MAKRTEQKSHIRGPKKITSIGKSRRTRIKNKSKRRHNGGSKSV